MSNYSHFASKLVPMLLLLFTIFIGSQNTSANKMAANTGSDDNQVLTSTSGQNRKPEIQMSASGSNRKRVLLYPFAHCPNSHLLNMEKFMAVLLKDGYDVTMLVPDTYVLPTSDERFKQVRYIFLFSNTRPNFP